MFRKSWTAVQLFKDRSERVRLESNSFWTSRKELDSSPTLSELVSERVGLSLQLEVGGGDEHHITTVFNTACISIYCSYLQNDVIVICRSLAVQLFLDGSERVGLKSNSFRAGPERVGLESNSFWTGRKQLDSSPTLSDPSRKSWTRVQLFPTRPERVGLQSN